MTKNKFAKLVNVKTIVTFVVVGVWATLVLRGLSIPPEVTTIVTAVIAFYFGTQSEKKGK